MKLTLNSGICSILLACSFFSCTNLQEEEAPVTFGVNVDGLSYDTGSSLRPVIISSGTKWAVAKMPSWMSLESISSSSGSPYEWTANFAVEANDGYNREGRIVINAKSESAEIAVIQKGKKGEYVAVESVSISPLVLTLTEGESSTLTYTINPSNASDKGVTWKSSSPSVATVSDSGDVKALAVGTTTLTVTTNDGSYTSSCSVTVVPPVSSIQLDKTEGSYYEGARIILNATIHPESEISRDIDWTSSDSEIADFIQFYSSGVKIRAKKEGNAIISASIGEKTAHFYLSVKRSESYSIQYITDDKQIVSPKGMGEIVSNTYGQYGLIRFNQPVGDIVSYSFCNDNGSIDFYNLRYIKIPEGVTWISGYAFYADHLEGISLPESLTNIGYFAFGGCPIEDIIIPKNVVEIQMGALQAYRSVIVEAEVPPVIEDDLLAPSGRVNVAQRIIVPDSSINVYKSDPYWGKYSSIMYPRSESEAFVQDVKQNFERRIQGY